MKIKKPSRSTYLAIAIILGLLTTGTLFQNCSQQKFTSTANPTKTLNTPQGEPSESSVVSLGDSIVTAVPPMQQVAPLPQPVTVPVVTAPTQVVFQPPAPSPAPIPAAVLPPAPPLVAICDAFGSGQTSVATAGLKAELRYLNPLLQMPWEQSSSILSIDYFKDADTRFIKVPEAIYFSDVNVPSRTFDQGFLNSKGVLLRDNQGNVLQEYFALKMETELRLASDEQDGYYEFATISDDGTVIEMMKNGVWTRIISNDGAHNPRMGCSMNKIYLDQQSRIPLRIYYNQGPKVTIANVFFKNYRGAKLTQDLLLPKDLEVRAVCGVDAETEFWNSVTSQPGQLIAKITAAGWKPLSPGNFQLRNNQINPCAVQ